VRAAPSTIVIQRQCFETRENILGRIGGKKRPSISFPETLVLLHGNKNVARSPILGHDDRLNERNVAIVRETAHEIAGG
jgi:hypothetical protein